MNHGNANDLSVSVIVPAYNAEASLGRTLESALAQELAPHQVIVIDDGSTDDTPEVARAFARRDDCGGRITCLEQENQGQGAARNAGLAVATGRFIAFLDADDYWHPAFLKHCVQFLETHPEAIAVSTGIIVRLWGKPERRWPPPVAPGGGAVAFYPGMIDKFYDFWGRHDHVRTGANLIRRSVIDQAGFQRADLRISQDLEYWGYLATWGKWGLILEHLWIGDPTPTAARQGLLNKYRQRRRLCPTVEQWESRIVPRLAPEQWEGFRRVRGRVAANFALSKIKSGAGGEAWEIVRKYGLDMPPNWSTHLMRLGLQSGIAGRTLAAMLIRLREHYKSARLGRRGGQACGPDTQV